MCWCFRSVCGSKTPGQLVQSEKACYTLIYSIVSSDSVSIQEMVWALTVQKGIYHENTPI